jgi:multidrug efflux system membrane fusion protein
VRSRVDGEVTKVAFKQGQMVNEGDVLVQIDPRSIH